MYGIKERGLIGDSFSFSYHLRVKSNRSYENNIKEDNNMITLSILTMILLSIAIAIAVIALTCGAGFIIAFGDLIVLGLIIVLIIKLFKKKKKS